MLLILRAPGSPLTQEREQVSVKSSNDIYRGSELPGSIASDVSSMGIFRLVDLKIDC